MLAITRADLILTLSMTMQKQAISKGAEGAVRTGVQKLSLVNRSLTQIQDSEMLSTLFP
jgi:hypothetical protein